MRIHFRKVKFLSSLSKVEPGGGSSATFTRRFISDVSCVAPAAVSGEEIATTRAPLVDLHGRRHNYLRISLTERCNLRCQYCMPAEGAPLSARPALLTRNELSRLLRLFVSLGVDKVRLTGGEPTLRRDLADIIQEVRSLGVRTVGLTTNGLVLTRQLPALQRAGLTALNISLDSLKPQRYEHMARRPGLSRVLAGIDLALQLGYRPLKINVVLMKGFNDDEICDFVELTRDREIEVRFIEFMPFSGNAWDDSKLVPYRTALRQISQQYEIDGGGRAAGETARVWTLRGHRGTVAFIASMTQPFCSTCNRLRLTADGNLKVCLFGASEVSLRDALRAGVPTLELEALVRAALNNKKPQHAEPRHDAEPAHGAHRRITYSHLPIPPQRRVPFAPIPPQRRVPFAPIPPQRRVPFAARGYCTKGDSQGGPFSHLDDKGRARMVDVGEKPVTSRVAEAECALIVGSRLLRLLHDARLPKGDALTVAQVAGAMAAKRTSELIPLCHPLPLDCVRVRVEVPPVAEAGGGGRLRVSCEVRVTARTGAEMEALTGCAVAALTLYDMCKSVDRAMKLTDLRVVRKAGGASGDFPPPPLAAIETRTNIAPDDDDPGTYAPTHFAHF